MFPFSFSPGQQRPGFNGSSRDSKFWPFAAKGLGSWSCCSLQRPEFLNSLQGRPPVLNPRALCCSGGRDFGIKQGSRVLQMTMDHRKSSLLGIPSGNACLCQGAQINHPGPKTSPGDPPLVELPNLPAGGFVLLSCRCRGCREEVQRRATMNS